MAYEQKNGDLIISKNKHKQDGDNKPDLTGQALVNGQKMKIALWKKGKDGRVFYSGKIEPDNYNGGASKPATEVGGMQGEPIDEGSIPF